MMKKVVLLLFILLGAPMVFCQVIRKEFRIKSQYLNIPVSMKQDRQMVKFLSGKDTLTYSVIRIADGDPDYWVFKDVSSHKGKKIGMIFSSDVSGIGMIYQSDRMAGADSLYSEKYRPQFHFTSARGWNNDPNGLVYLDGEYHLFYQHNPYETKWENMHWGHAVSNDLLHWKELNDALFPDRIGTMFSGSAVIDGGNTSGWGKDVMVAAYTAAGKEQVQCIAYSRDRGRTFIKFRGNPVVGPTRDPKVIWYEPDKRWVMALYKDAGISFFTSANLKDWKEESHVNGFYECPELFQLSIDGDPGEKLWVLYAGSGTYMLGDFNGREFLPLFGKYRTTYGLFYAAQTYNNLPEDRRVQIGWGRIEHQGMPFSQMMCFPTELSLRTTNEGIRMFSEPVKEINELHGKKYDFSGMEKEQVNGKLNEISHDLLHVKMRIESLDGSAVSVSYKGNRYARMDADEINGVQCPLEDPAVLVFDVEMLIDRTSVEMFFQEGKMVFVEQLKKPSGSAGLRIEGNGRIKISSLEIWELNSVWR